MELTLDNFSTSRSLQSIEYKRAKLFKSHCVRVQSLVVTVGYNLKHRFIRCDELTVEVDEKVINELRDVTE